MITEPGYQDVASERPMLNLVTGGASWREALADYAAWCRSCSMSQGTIRLRLLYLARLAAVTDAPFELAIDDLVEFLSPAGWAPETRKSARAALRSFFRWACDTGRVEKNPTERLPAVRVPAGMPRPAPEAVVLEALARSSARDRLMVMLAAYAGLRCCEIARCHTDDVVDGRLRVTGKGKRQRLVPLTAGILRAIPDEPGWLFPSPHGGHLRADSVSVILRRALAPYTAHTLRHRFATRAYAGTRDLRAVQELLGHSKPETTMRYTLVPDDALRAAVLAAAS